MSIARESAELSRTLASLHERERCVLFASGTAALSAALSAAGISGRDVAIPCGTCLNVPLAVYFSGNRPVYLDVDPATLGLSVALLETLPRPPAAVIAVHGYGYVCDISGISEWCRRHGVFLVEDVAVAMGARVAGRPAGAFGDVAVLSFGAGKIIDAGGGGAALCEDPAMARALRQAEEGFTAPGSDASAKVAQFGRQHTSLYNAEYGRHLARHAPAFKACAMQLRQAFLERVQPERFVLAARTGIGRLEENLASRQAKAERLAARFSPFRDLGIVPFEPPPGSVIWRFNLTLHERRGELLERLLSRRYRVSSWHPSADLFLEGRQPGTGSTPVSDRIGDTILNLWVNEEVDEVYLDSIAREVIDFFGTRR